MIIKFYSFIQFYFDKVTLILWSGRSIYMLTRVGSGWIFQPFFIFFSISSFNILFATNWASIFFFILFYTRLSHSHLIFVLLSNKIFQHLFFFSILSFSILLILLIEDWYSCFFFPTFLSIRLSQSFTHGHRVTGLTRFDLCFFLFFFLFFFWFRLSLFFYSYYLN